MGEDVRCPMPRKNLKKATSSRSSREVLMSRPPMERMWKIHQEISAGGFPNCQKLSVTLEVSPKTVMRDIDFMRDRLKLPLAYDPVRHGFYYTASVQDFPMMKITQGEVAALLLAQKSLEQFQGTPFEQPLATAFRKLSRALHGPMEVTWHELEQALSVRSSGTGLTDMQVFDALARAVTGGAEVTFAYHKLSGDAPETRTVQPYHLGCIEHQWYLFAHDVQRGAVRTFALPRIAGVEQTGEKFRRPQSFSLAKILEGSFAVFQGGNAKRVRIRFCGVAARLVAERSWHPSQKLHVGKESVVLEMQTGLSPDLQQWILGWGEEAEVLEPASLRQALAVAAQKTANIYNRSIRKTTF